MKPGTSKVTLQTLADQLGVSTATVSRALKNDRIIHSKTRARVMAAAARLGYDRPTRGAGADSANLRVLLLLPPYVRQMQTSIFPAYLRGMATAATALGCSLVVEELTDTQYGKMSRRAHLPRAVRSDHADVVVLTGHHHTKDVSVLTQHLPVVSIQWEYPADRTDLVTAFNAHGIVDLVSALVRCGHRGIAWVGAHFESSFFWQRQAGFLQGCLQGNIFPDSKLMLSIKQVDAPLLRRLIKEGLTALVAANDDTAVQLANLCWQHGIRIPEDLSLTGFDGSHLPLANGKRLTTYDPSLSELGQAAVELAVQRTREPGARRMMQSREGHVMEGETVASLDKMPVQTSTLTEVNVQDGAFRVDQR